MTISIEADGLGECNMLKRILTSVIGLIVFFAALLSGNVVFSIAVAIVTLGMLYEMYRAVNAGIFLSVMGIISGVVLFAGATLGWLLPALLFSMMLFMTASVFLHGKVDYKTVYSSAFVGWYVVLFMMCIPMLNREYSIFATILVFLCAWVTDTGAYFAGYFFGKHKLIEKVSPKKTVEGAIGGVCMCALGCGIYALILQYGFHEPVSYMKFVLLGVVASIVSQIGDLVASCIKRDSGVKDFGRIFPGHGGILDRFDSVLFVAPLVYFFVKFIGLS